MKEVLIAEDDDLLRGLLVSLFQKSGYLVSEASDGLMAMKMIEKKNFDFVLSDVKMPKADGFQVLKTYRSRSKGKFYFITGFSEICEEKTAKELGADGLLKKPFVRADILALIHSGSSK